MGKVRGLSTNIYLEQVIFSFPGLALYVSMDSLSGTYSDNIQLSVEGSPGKTHMQEKNEPIRGLNIVLTLINNNRVRELRIIVSIVFSTHQ